MMGGGMLLRTVARAVGSTGPNPAVTGPASTSFCSNCRGQLTRPSNLKTSCSHGSNLSQQADTIYQTESLKEWEFAGFEDETDGKTREHLIFGSMPASQTEELEDYYVSDQCWRIFGLPPSVDEAQQAATELQVALSAASLPTTELRDNESSSVSSASNTPFVDMTKFEYIPEKNQDSDEPLGWSEPRVVLSGSGTGEVAKNPVYEAFQLLQRDPNVKGAVISIVSDPDVWHAMMKNEKVQELKRIFQESQGPSEIIISSANMPIPAKQDFLGGVLYLLHYILRESKQALFQMKDNAAKLIQSISHLFSEKQEKDDSSCNKAVRSSMMLAVIVLAIVLVKRVQA